MHRKGHVGMTLLTFAPVAYVLVSEGKPIFAALCFLGVQTVEPWPDQDFHLPFLTHRGASHSLLAILVVGGVLGAVGWFLGGNLFDLLLAVLLAGGDLFGWVLGLLPDASADMINLLLPNISLEAVVNRAHVIAGESVSRWTFAAYGLFVGAYGIFSHLLGDVITMSGIKPFLPLSRWRFSLSSLHADSPTANSSLFFIGILAVGVVLVMTVPAALGLTPATLSPIGTVSAQSANQSGASVVFENQTANDSSITIERVTLPDNGFVGIHVTQENGSLGSSSLLGVSDHLSIGTHRNVSINVSLNGSQTLVAVPYRDLNEDNKFNRKTVFGPGASNATFTTESGRTVRDIARVRVPTSEQAGRQNQTAGNGTASVIFTNQTTNGSTITIKRATLPEGGFIAVHGPAYAEKGIVSGTVITVSEYLAPGTHRNITIRTNNSVSGPLSVVLYQDNGNKRYDFVESFGQNDTPYRRGGERVDDQARVVTQQQRDRQSGPTAAITFTNQTLTDGTLTVARVRLPHGGWVVIHNQSYITENDPLNSVIGRSKYLSAGLHRNVTVALDQPLARLQMVVAVAYRDTNGNQNYDYVSSGGMADYAYVNRTGNATIVTDRAHVSIPSAATTPGQTASSPTAVTSNTSTPAPTSTPSASGGSGALSGVPLWLEIIIALVGVVVGLSAVGRVT